jgi:hypothetical protein
VTELLDRMGSAELTEWIAELRLRADEEKTAVEKAKNAQPAVFGQG